MRRMTVLSITLLAAWSPAKGDEVTLAKMAYTNVAVTGVQDGKITFRTAADTEVGSELADVVQVQLVNRGQFNEAEKLLRAGEAARAVDAYDQAAPGAAGWFAILLRARRLKALEQTDDVARTVQEWLALVEKGEMADWTIALRPRKLVKAGAAANDLAIRSLESRLQGIKQESFRSAVQQLLLLLYERQGRAEDVAVLAGKIAGQKPQGSPTALTMAATEVQLDTQLDAAKALLDQGKAAETLKAIQSQLRAYSPGQLPTALCLSGKARLSLAAAAAGDEARRLYVSAGLDFMRVVAYYPTAAEAAEALYLAGRVNENLDPPNHQAAANAYRQVIAGYGQTKVAAEARKALANLRPAGSS